jgi:hypothetical protein
MRNAEVMALAIAGVLASSAVGWVRLHGRKRALHHHASARPSGPVLRVPRAKGPIVVDGEFEEPAWRDAALGGAFLDPKGEAARPHSELRALWGPSGLYLALYAADQNIEEKDPKPDGPLWNADSFRLVFELDGEERQLDIAPHGAVTDGVRVPGRAVDFGWQSGARVGSDVDGTVNDRRDDDEEWVEEVLVPWSALGLQGKAGEQVTVRASRCDVPKSGVKSCGSVRLRLELSGE